MNEVAVGVIALVVAVMVTQRRKRVAQRLGAYEPEPESSKRGRADVPAPRVARRPAQR